jgi:hypothetical protein
MVPDFPQGATRSGCVHDEFHTNMAFEEAADHLVEEEPLGAFSATFKDPSIHEVNIPSDEG